MHPTPTTLITGAAQRIGAGLARHLAAQGHALVLHYHRSQEAAQALAAELIAGGTCVELRQADLSQAAACAALWHGLPPVTHIVHNASIYRRDTLATLQPETLRAHLALHVEAPLLLAQQLLRQLPAGTTGSFTVLGDDSLGWSIAPQFFSYAVSKHLWRSVVDLLAAAGAPRLRANVIALAPTLPAEDDPPGLFDRLRERAPLQRTGTLEEVCRALDYVLAAPGLTGQVIGLGNGMANPTHRPQAAP
jgi:NAD(P)-dependent dehydrogenase (short-subunit alcohol dehydrogenase family)